MENKSSEVPRGYKKTELGIIPEEWSISSIEKVCEILDNRRLPVTKSKREIGNIPYYGATGIVDYVKDYIFDEELILIGEDGADWSSFANTAYIIKGKSWVNNHAHVLRCSKINSVFLKEFINMSDLDVYINGTTRGKLNQANLRKIKVPVPSFYEQQKIASILSKVDEQIEQTEQIIEKTEILKKGLMQKLLTKGIGHTKFKKTELGEIPEEWDIVSIQKLIDEDIIYSNQDGNHGELHPKSSDYVCEGIPFIMANNLVKNSVDLINCKKISLEQANSLRIKPAIKGDILISHKGTIGRTAIVQDSKYPFIVLTPQVTYYRIKNLDRLEPIYLYCFFQSPNFQKMMEDYSKQSTRNFISISSQRRLNIILPTDIEEQQKIASILSKVDSQIQDSQNYLSKLQELKKGLMQDLLTGKVRVCV